MGQPTRSLSAVKAMFADRLLGQQRGKCALCGQTLDWLNATLHHVIARSKGGADEFENLVALHRACHDRADRENLPFPGKGKTSASQLQKVYNRALREAVQFMVGFARRHEAKASIVENLERLAAGQLPLKRWPTEPKKAPTPADLYVDSALRIPGQPLPEPVLPEARPQPDGAQHPQHQEQDHRDVE